MEDWIDEMSYRSDYFGVFYVPLSNVLFFLNEVCALLILIFPPMLWMIDGGGVSQLS